MFVLGPPRKKELLDQSDPSKKDKDQIYNFGAYMGLLEQVAPAFGSEPIGPFDDRFSLPLEGTKALTFFKQRYWADTNDEELAQRIDNTQDWRRIDADWMGVATTLAMQLDQDTNNTSLVLAFELGPKKESGPVLLFAADAQVGNWLSWQDVTWTFEGRTVSGPRSSEAHHPLQGRPSRQPQRHAQQARPRAHDLARAGAGADRRQNGREGEMGHAALAAPARSAGRRRPTPASSAPTRPSVPGSCPPRP